jgi:hypothetical protein
MPIEVTCQCGKILKAKDEHVGLKAKCPSCGVLVDIRAATPAGPTNPDSYRIADLQKALQEDAGREREASLADLLKVLNTIAASIAALTSTSSSSPMVQSNGNQQREYKVITQKDKWFSGKFDPEKVEGALNSYAKQGWTLKGVATASVPGFGGQRDEIVIIMER